MPPAIAIARFLHHYGAGVYRGPAYRTRDAVIPFGLFWTLYAAMTHTMALERVNHARAVVHALAMAFSKKGGASDELTRSEFAEAFLGPR